MSVPRHVYINKIRELGYWVETTLKRAGLTEEEAKKFIGAAKT